MTDEHTENIPAESAESFAELFEKSNRQTERLRPGQKVRAEVVSISGDLVYIDLGGKSEGVINLSEFTDKEGVVTVKTGDSIEAFFVSVQNGIRKLTTIVSGYSAVSLNNIRDAFEANIPVSGEVRREVKGGFEVSVGGVRSFCPFSQIDLRGGREGGVYLGMTFPFKVLEFKENGRNIVLSRRAVLDQERLVKIEEFKKTLLKGSEVPATVVSLQKFGAFVDLGGIDGLIPISELAWERVPLASDVLSVGQQITAKIISADWDANRITLSLKAMQQDPWTGVADRYPADSKVKGVITRLSPFGAFVKLEAGIEGLVHISNLGAGRRINHPKEVVAVGQEVEVYVLAADAAARKISLSLQPKVEPKKIELPEVGAVLDGVVDKVMPFGVFVKMSSGLTGLVPNSETGTAGGTDLKKVFPAGSAIQTIVTEVDTTSGKVRLSRKALSEKSDEGEYKEYLNTVKKTESSSGGLGSLGELLKAKMDEKKQSA
ncbi:MAG: S1 RNA-binding domain-containing protein [Nitrospirae bacterium]|nr:MAG: S1 RNA-binding domain-containing protein [Nitrospirota bacterium]